MVDTRKISIGSQREVILFDLDTYPILEIKLENDDPGAELNNILMSDADGVFTLQPVPGGGGIVSGPGLSVDNALVRWDGTTGYILQSSVVIVSDAGLISNVLDPANSQDAATKEYVDSAIAFEFEFFLNNTASDIGGIYYKMLDLPTGEVQSSFTSAPLGESDDQPLVNFATEAGVPSIGTFQHGIYSAHIHAEKTVGIKPVQIYFAIYRYEPDTTETLITTSEVSDLITSETEVELHAVLASDVEVNNADRLILKWFANVGATGSDATVVLYVEGTTAAHLLLPITTEILTSIFVRRDGTVSLTGDWDAGPFDITLAGIFESTIGDVRLSGVQSPRINWETNSADSSARNWEIKTNRSAFGDFQILKSLNNSSAPATKALTFGRDGLTTLFFDVVATLNLTVEGQYHSTLHDNGNSGASEIIDWGNGNNQYSTLTADCTYTFSNEKSGAKYVLYLKQGGVGGWTVTWPADVTWPGGTPPVLSTAAGARDIVTFVRNSVDSKNEGVGFAKGQA